MQTKSGKQLFPIGIGTWNIGGIWNPNDPTAKYKGAEPSYDNEEAEIEAVRYSISKGQNLHSWLDEVSHDRNSV